MKTAVIYARYSSNSQTEQSIEGQLRVCYDYAKNNNITVIAEYIDRATTGTNDNRESFQKMIKDSNKQVWDLVIVYKLDRFSRNKFEMATHKKTLKDNGVKLVSATENIPETPEGIILESMLEGMAEYYSAELSQKVKRGMRESRSKGNFTGGQIVFGYSVVGDRINGRKVVINPEEAEIVKRIFEEYASGTTVIDIIANLTKDGILRFGKPFAKNTLLDLLHNEKYIGTYYPAGEKNTNTYPRIISDELFEVVRAKKESNKYGKETKIEKYLLRNKVKCGYCGKTVIGDLGTARNGSKVRYYNCNGRKHDHKCKKKLIRKEDFERIVVDTTIKILGNKHVLSSIADMILSRHEKERADSSILTILNREKEQTQTAIDNLISAIEQGIISHSTKSRLDQLELKLEEIDAKIQIAKNNIDKEIKKEEIVDYIKTALKKEPRTMINLLIDHIVLYDDKMEITYKYTQKSPDENQDFLFYTETATILILDKINPKKKNNDFLVELYY